MLLSPYVLVYTAMLTAYLYTEIASNCIKGLIQFPFLLCAPPVVEYCPNYWDSHSAMKKKKKKKKREEEGGGGGGRGRGGGGGGGEEEEEEEIPQ